MVWDNLHHSREKRQYIYWGDQWCKAIRLKRIPFLEFKRCFRHNKQSRRRFLCPFWRELIFQQYFTISWNAKSSLCFKETFQIFPDYKKHASIRHWWLRQSEDKKLVIQQTLMVLTVCSYHVTYGLRLNSHSVVASMSRNSLFEADTKSNV